MELLKQIPSSEEVIAKYPLTAQCAKIKLERDKEIRRVFENKSNQLLLIIGPCSADNEKAVLEYVLRLAKIHEKVQDRILIIPRIYTSKPRTNGNGYKGLLHQPFIGSGEDMAVGIFAVRRIHIKVIEETGLFSADEMLYPEVLHYIYDLLSYVTIGARSVENQQHRLTASGLDVPVGMKNPISGNIKTMLNAVSTAQ
ncbi:MAG: 3-deoxy-7-phosphoheptulonate synthase, partial [Prevotellaceae bacterium]|nr:3-deoxy-7-phosphoheptulonate synthase [Prevotellaceae bacterium]